MGNVEVHALRNISTSVSKGEFVAIMGASGSGKSTFMNIIGCLDKQTKGDFFLDGVDVAKLNRNQLASIRNKKLDLCFKDLICLLAHRRLKMLSYLYFILIQI